MHNSFSLQRLLLQPSPVWHLRAAAAVSSASSKKATWASRCTESSVSWCSCECDSLARAAAKFIPVWVLPRCLSSLGASSLRCCRFGRGYPTPPSSRANSHQLRKQLRAFKNEEEWWLRSRLCPLAPTPSDPRLAGSVEVQPLPGVCAGEGRQKEEPAAFYSAAHLQTCSKGAINN